MADEWWSSARTDGRAWACSVAPASHLMDAAESATTSGTSIDFQPGLHGASAAASSSSFLADPHMGWTQTSNSTATTTTSNALVQLHGYAGRHFLLDQPSPTVLAQHEVDGTAPVASAWPTASSLYGDNQSCSSAMSYGDTPAAPMGRPFAGFFGSSNGSFGGPPAEPPALLLQAQEPKRFKSNSEPAHQDACSSVTRRSVPDSPSAAKKARMEMPSPLPTFKVRKEKLGDRITALQQLVSPFGKTDTASVLHEAIGYIKFLHDQVASLSSPYMRCTVRPVQLQQQQAKDGGEAKENLRSRGLCLVPVASTYTVASETAPEFWHPGFGGTFR